MRYPNRRRRGWISTLMALALLVMVGFVFGALAGFLWEEPRLVIAYLSGETDEVDWNAEGQPIADAEPVPDLAPDPEPDPDVAAAPPVEAAKSAAASPRVAAKAAPENAGAGRFAIQVGAFGESTAAESLAKRLRERGYTTYVTPSAGGNAPRWRVRVGPVPAREAADRLATRLKRDEKLPTWVLDEDEG